MKRGVSFELPNEYGSFLGDALKPFDSAAFCWKIGSGETYKIVEDELGESLFPTGEKVLDGSELKTLLETSTYYVIFAELQAYPKGKSAKISTYEDFLKSDCELVLLVADSCNVSIYCKDEAKVSLLYTNAQECGFEAVAYLTDVNDTRTRLSVW